MQVRTDSNSRHDTLALNRVKLRSDERAMISVLWPRRCLAQQLRCGSAIVVHGTLLLWQRPVQASIPERLP